MTTAGGLGHTLPFLISSFHVAFVVAVLVVAVELAVISYVRHATWTRHFFPPPCR